MGHYDTQIEQDNKDKRKWHREQLETCLTNTIIGMSNEDLEILVIAAENWGSVVSVIDAFAMMVKK